MPAYTRNPQTVPDDSPGGSTIRQSVKDQNSKAIDDVITDLNVHSNNEDGFSHIDIDASIKSLQQTALNSTVPVLPSDENKFLSNDGTDVLWKAISQESLVSSFELAEDMTAGEFAQILNDGTISSGIVTQSMGTNEQYSAGNSLYNSAIALTSSKVLIAYRDNANSNYGTAVIADIDGVTIILGTPHVFNSAATSYTSVTKLTDNKAIVSYQDAGNSNYGTAIVLNISGNTVTSTPGEEHVFESAATNYTAITALTSTKAVVSYQDAGNSSHGTAIVLEISGDTISSTPANAKDFAGRAAFFLSIDKVTDSKAIVIFRSGTDGNAVCVVLSVSGTLISEGAEEQLSTDNCNDMYVRTISENKAVAVYSESSHTPDKFFASVVKIDGNSLKQGGIEEIAQINTDYPSISIITNDRIAVPYIDNTNSSYGTLAILQLSGENEIEKTDSLVFESNTTGHMTSTEIVDSKILCAYYRTTGSPLGTQAKAIELPSINIDVGIDKTGLATNIVKTTTQGRFTTQETTLIPGVEYYIDSDGSYTTESVGNVFVGTAISTTDILFSPNKG